MLFILNDLSIWSLTSLVILAFLAGFMDAVVGGGGLIQLPTLLVNFSQAPLTFLLGTNKLAAFTGTGVSALQYAKKVRFNYMLVFCMGFCAFVFSFLGAKTISYVSPQYIKPFIFVLLIAIATYTFIKKDLGKFKTKHLSLQKQIFYGMLVSTFVGFYDGFLGPGTGSFLVLSFVLILGFEFIEASAYAKLINCITNISALIVFVIQGNIYYDVAIMMAIFNMLGSFMGTRLAIQKGNSFVRIFFMIVVMIMIGKYALDIFF